MDNQKEIPYSTKSRYCEKDIQIFPVMDVLLTDVIVTVKLQIIFFEYSDLDDIGNITTYEANIAYSAPSFQALSITVSTLYVYDTLLLL